VTKKRGGISLWVEASLFLLSWTDISFISLFNAKSRSITYFYIRYDLSLILDFNLPSHAFQQNEEQNDETNPFQEKKSVVLTQVSNTKHCNRMIESFSLQERSSLTVL
jgi:hypothetical protein